MKSNRSPNFSVISIVLVFGAVGFAVMAPVVYLYADDLGLDGDAATALALAMLATAAVDAFMAWRLANRDERRNVDGRRS